MKNYRIILFMLIIAVLAFLLGNSVSNIFSIEITKPRFIEISYADFIIILLTCLALMITVVTVGVGFMTIIGWQNLKASAVEEAAKVVEIELQNSESDLSKRLIKGALKGITSVDEEIERGEFD